MSTLLSTLGSWLVALGIMLGAVMPSFGAVNPGATPLFDTVLTQQLGTSDTTAYLKTMTDSQGNVLTGYQCFTIDVNSPSVEYVCGTVSGLTVTGLTRNLSYQTGTSTYATPTNIHRVGADVRITDFPALTILNNQANGKETFNSPLTYLIHPCSVSSASTTLCDKDYADKLIAAGAAAGSNSVAGIFLTATGLQAASSTASGIYNAVTYLRVLPSSIATDTPNTGTNTSDVLMSDLTGHLKQGWLDLTQPFTFTGNVSSTIGLFTSTGGFLSTGSTTINNNATTTGNMSVSTLTVNGSRYTNLAGTGLINSGGSLITVKPYAMGNFSTSASAGTYSTSTQVLGIPASTLAASSTINIRGSLSCTVAAGSPTCTWYLRDSTGATLFSFTKTTSATDIGTVDVTITGATATSQTACYNSFLSGENTVFSACSTINLTMANLSTFVLVSQSSSNATTNWNTASIIVTP